MQNSVALWYWVSIIGKDKKGAIVTLEERTTKKLLMSKSLEGKNAKAFAKLVVQLLKSFEQCVRTITTNNESELVEHKYIEKKLHTKVYISL